MFAKSGKGVTMNRKSCIVACLSAFLMAGVSVYGMPMPPANNPPAPINFPSGYQTEVFACPGDTLDITPGFTGPESNQTVTVTVTDNSGAQANGLVIETNNGNPGTTRLIWSPLREHVGTYQLSFRATDNGGGNNTTTVTMTINVTCPCNPPAVDQQPASSTNVCEGNSFTASVQASGDMPMQYQWRKDGNPIPGATSAIFTIDSVTLNDAGDYSCALNNSCYNETSASARLVVDSPPTVTTDPTGVISCPNDEVTFTADASGTAPISFQWMKDNIDIPGAVDRTLTLPGAVASDAGSYSCRVSNGCGEAVTAVGGLIVLEDTHFTMHPVSRTTCEGNTVVLGSEVVGTDPISVQWFHNGQAVDGANNTTLEIPAATPDASGEYAIVATNECGSTTSRMATVIIDTVPEITSDLQDQISCPGDSAQLQVAVSAAGTAAINYQWYKDGVLLDAVHGDTLTLPGVTAADAGEYSVTVANSCGQTSSSVARLSVLEDAGIVTAPASQSACPGEPATFSIGVSGTGPIAYQWQKNGMSIAGATGSTFTIDSVQASDAGIYRCWVSNECSTVVSGNAALILGAGPSISEHPQDQSACPGESVTFSAGTAREMVNYQWRKDGIDIPGANSNTFTISSVTASDVGAYSAAVSNGCGQTVSNSASLSLHSGEVTILQHPLSADLCTGNSLTLSIAAIGSPAPTFQWRKNGVSIPGEITDTFTIPVVTVEDTATYDVEVSAGTDCGSIISDAAAVVVWPTGSGDINGDGASDGLDISVFVETILRNNSGPAANLANCGADMNANGTIDMGDLSGFLSGMLNNG